jgi:hypothetical protein
MAVYPRIYLFTRELSQSLTKFPAVREKEMMLSLAPTICFLIDVVR